MTHLKNYLSHFFASIQYGKKVLQHCSRQLYVERQSCKLETDQTCTLVNAAITPEPQEENTHYIPSSDLLTNIMSQSYNSGTIRITGITSFLAIMLALAHLFLMYVVPDDIKGVTYCLFRVRIKQKIAFWFLRSASYVITWTVTSTDFYKLNR